MRERISIAQEKKECILLGAGSAFVGNSSCLDAIAAVSAEIRELVERRQSQVIAFSVQMKSVNCGIRNKV